MVAKGTLYRSLLIVIFVAGSLFFYREPAQAASDTSSPVTWTQGDGVWVPIRAMPTSGDRLAPGTTRIPSNQGDETVFTALLNGHKEIPPVDTTAKGVAKINAAADGSRLQFVLIGKDLRDLTAAHIHCAARGSSGPIGVTLWTGGPISIQFWQIFTSGTVTAPDAGNACGWTTLNDVIAAMRDGSAYVNYHTLANPTGEVRGWLRPIR